MVTIFTGAPYLGIGKGKLEEIIKLSRVQNASRVRTVDLGSGDGRIVIAMARRGAQAYGYELNPFFVFLSWWNIYRAGVWGESTCILGKFMASKSCSL